MADPFRYFRIEANELADQLDRELLALEARPDGERVARLLRLAHTLKGAARIVKHGVLADLAHGLEDALTPLRGSGLGALDATLAIARDIIAQVAALAPAPAASSATAPAASSAVVIELAASERASDTAALPRVDPGLLDHLIGELGELHAQLDTLRAARPDVPELDALGRGLGGVRNSAEHLRLLPASTVLGSLERTARDAAHGTGKTVTFASSGGEVRVDARVLTGLHGALVQLVRNAVVHGIEPAAARRAAGKPEAGRVAIAIRIHGERVIMQCDDDGRGIDLGAVHDAVIARGLVARDAAPTDDQLIDLLLRGGVSTALGVTPLAGRGIGLDLVRDAAQVLGGEVSVRTTPGTGTSIALDVPCSVLSVPVLTVIAGDRTVAIPQTSVRRVVTLARDELGAGVLSDSDARCKLVALARLLDAPVGAPSLAVVLGHRDATGDVEAALAIDRVSAIVQLVVRPLPETIPVSPVIRGMALDAAGEPRPVLDPAAVIAAVLALPPEAGPAAPRRPPILVVDDSLTTRTLEQSMLEAAGYDVDVAASAELGLERAAERAYGLFLVDLEMPGLDGIGFIQAIRARSQTPAVLVTSRDTPEDRQRGHDAGAQGYLIKGALDQHELLSLVARLIA